MPLVAIALVLGAGVLHVAWNTLVKTSGDPLETATWAVWLGTAAATPLVAVAWLAAGQPTLPVEGWLLAVASGIVEVGYYVALAAAYRSGDLSAVYPVARGSAAFLGVVVGIAILGERLPPSGAVAIVLLLGGLLAAAVPAARLATMGPALLTGLTIAGYSALDRVGVRTGPPWLYGWAIFAVSCVALVVLRAAWPRARSVAPGNGTSGSRRHLATGLLMLATYLLVLLALQIAPLAGVAPLREASTVLAAVWGVVALGERTRAGWRIAGGVAVAAGAILLAVGT